MRRFVLLSLAAVTACVGVFLLVLALDVHRWQEQTVADDASFRAFPLAEDAWRHSTVLPAALVRTTVGATEDMRYRDAVRAFFLARPRARGLFQLPELEASRGEAQIVLTDTFRHEREPLRRAHIGTLLGALALAVSPQQDVEQRVTTLEAAIAYLQETVRLDPANEDAKFNLESALRRLRSEPPTFETARGGRRPRDDESVAGLRDIGGGY
jgi:hypothetical protein